MKRRPHLRNGFELRVLPRNGSSYSLALFQPPLGGHRKRSAPERVVEIWGPPLAAVIDQVLTALHRGGYRPSDLRPSRRAPFCLPEEEAVRLGLLFLAVKPLRRHERIDAISRQLGAMEPEELYYWYSKAAARGEDATGHRALRALRILIAGE